MGKDIPDWDTRIHDCIKTKWIDNIGAPYQALLSIINQREADFIFKLIVPAIGFVDTTYWMY